MPNLPNPVPFHTHPHSIDSASTPQSFIDREVELGTGHAAATDHGSLAAVKQMFDLAREKGLTFSPGLEAYFRDDDCPILLGQGVPRTEETVCGKCMETWSKDGPKCDCGVSCGVRRQVYRETYAKYFHCTMHFRDYPSYLRAVRLLTKRDLGAERHGQERKPIFNWADMEELAAGNVTVGSSCLIGVVSRHLLARDNMEGAVAYYDRFRSLFRDRFLVELFPHCTDRNWVQGVRLHFRDGAKEKWWFGKRLRTNVGEISAQDLAAEFGRRDNRHAVLLAVKHNRSWEELPEPRAIEKVERLEDFLENDCKVWSPTSDYQLHCNGLHLELARRFGDPIVVSDDSHYARAKDSVVQDIRLGQAGNWRFWGKYHRQTGDESFEHFSRTLGTTEAEFRTWVENGRAWAESFKGLAFPSAPMLPKKFYPGDSVERTFQLIDKHGRMLWGNPVYEERLRYELELFTQTEVKTDSGKRPLDLLPYFFPIEEVCSEYASRGELTGVGRGSAAGTLLAYLLGITHADPIRYKLSIDRFLTKDRVEAGKLPDIDQDLPDRSWLLEPGGWLERRFGDHVAQIGTDMKLSLRSSVKDVHRALHGVAAVRDVEELTQRFAKVPQGISDLQHVDGYKDGDNWVPGALETDPALREYVARYPREWEVVRSCLALARGRGRHACGYVILDRPVGDVIPLTEVQGHRVTQYTADAVDSVGAVKYDFLGIDTLLYQSGAVKLIHQRCGGVPDGLSIGGKWVPKHRLVPVPAGWADIWDLPDDQSVYDDIVSGRSSSVFQFGSDGARQWMKYFDFDRPDGSRIIRSIYDLAVFTALDRPGPLDAYVTNPEDGTKHNMLVEYARRARGLPASPDIPEVVSNLMPETFGIMVFQEQLQYSYQQITGCTGAEAEAFRRDIAKKKMDKVLKKFDFFVQRGALVLGSEEGARKVWEMYKTFGQYGFNASIAGNTIIPVWNEAPKPLHDFRPGDRVPAVGDNGELVVTEVVALHDHGYLPGLEVFFDDGFSMVVSVRHKFLTDKGQVPLYQIVEQGLEVLCEPDWATSWAADSTHDLRCVLATERGRTSQTDVPGVCAAEEGQHQSSNAPPQSATRAARCILAGSSKNFSSAGDFGTTCRTTQGLEGERAGEVRANSCPTFDGSEEQFPRGKLVERVSTLGDVANQLRNSEETGGHGLSRRTCLDRGGRILALFRPQEREGSASEQADRSARSGSSQGRDVESRGPRSGCLPSSNRDELFLQQERSDERDVASVADSNAPLADAGRLLRRRVVRVRSVGFIRMYDLEVAHPRHNFLLLNGAVTSNSHSVCYSIIGYVCAYLKRHFPLEWWCSVLSHSAKDKIQDVYWPHVAHLVSMPDVNRSQEEFTIHDGKLMAPLSLADGVGEKAHAELLAGRPYSSIEDFCQKVMGHKLAHARSRTSDGVQKTTLGTSALNGGVVYDLILCGAMDSLFPQSTVFEKLAHYERAMAEAKQRATGKKVKVDPVDQFYLSLDALGRYQKAKEILPVFSRPLTDLIPEGFFHGGETKLFFDGSEWLPIVKKDELVQLEELQYVPEDGFTVSVAAYISSVRPFTYGDQQRWEVTFDLDGGRHKSVFWGRKGLDGYELQPGSVCVLALTRRKVHRGFSIKSWRIVRGPLEKESDDSGVRVWSVKHDPPKGAVLVDRSTCWGNPYSHLPAEVTNAQFRTKTVREAIEAYEGWLRTQPQLMARLGELKGRDLVCHCAPKKGLAWNDGDGMKCHAQTLLRLANCDLLRGWNIWSGSQDGAGIAAALTNPTELSYAKGTVSRHYPVSFGGREWSDAEAAFLTLREGMTDKDADVLMVSIIVEKLRQFPDLVAAVKTKGGRHFLEACSHKTGARSAQMRAWEGEGVSSRFIRNLVAAFESVTASAG